MNLNYTLIVSMISLCSGPWPLEYVANDILEPLPKKSSDNYQPVIMTNVVSNIPRPIPIPSVRSTHLATMIQDLCVLPHATQTTTWTTTTPNLSANVSWLHAISYGSEICSNCLSSAERGSGRTLERLTRRRTALLYFLASPELGHLHRTAQLCL